MITLTTEQAQQIEEALVEYHDTQMIKAPRKALSIIRAARAQDQTEQEPTSKAKALDYAILTLHSIACLTQGNNLLWWQKSARNALAEIDELLREQSVATYQEPASRAILCPPPPPEVYQMRSRDAYEAGWYVAQKQKAVSPIAPAQQAEQEPGFYGRAAARLSQRVKELELEQSGKWRDHVEHRMLTWKTSHMNESGDQLSLKDFMDEHILDDLIDFVCDEYTARTKALTDDESLRTMGNELYVKLAKESGLWDAVGYPKEAVAFANLVAAHEKKFWMEQIEVECNEAVLSEREACAKVVESGVLGHGECAAAIRARGN